MKDINIIADELWRICKDYNGVPSQTVDKRAYSKALRIIKTYGETPQIKAVIKEYNISLKSYNKDKESHIAEILAILEERKAMPNSSQEKALYGFVKDFFRKYKDDPEIEKLKYQYVGPSCFPLPDSVYSKFVQEKMEVTSTKSHLIDAYKYILYVWNQYGILPADNTKPMQEVMHKIEYYSKYAGQRMSNNELDGLFSFSKTLEELGCKDKLLCNIYHCPEFESESVQNRVRNLVIENGSCAIKYIAEIAIPGVSLPEKFVYYYYYSCAYNKEDYWTIRPLGYIYAGPEDFGRSFLRVHYRDYKNCQIDRIRESAKSNFRNWTDNPPKTLDDWKFFGQCGLFVEDWNFNSNKLKPISEDWSETIIDYAFKTSDRYFYVYDRFKYFDYLLFLLENGYKLYASQMTNWLASWIDAKGFTSEDESIRQKVRELLKNKNIDLEDLPKYGSI